jgi:hypothetical protein
MSRAWDRLFEKSPETEEERRRYEESKKLSKEENAALSRKWARPSIASLFHGSHSVYKFLTG